ncbi:MAG: hypothetical protein U0L09_10465, partial [Christensenellales bacterium]|nr:hypothetical protein [Christensenellales bacterium]
MQKGHKRQGRGLAVLRFFIGLFIVAIVVLIGMFVLQLDYSDQLTADVPVRDYVVTTEAPMTGVATPAPVAASGQTEATAVVDATQSPTPKPT